MLKALHSTHMQELTPLHWCCYVDGHGINLDGELCALYCELQRMAPL